MEYKTLIKEFFKYILVGGISFIADIAAIYLSKEYILLHFPFGLYLSVIIGFIIGLSVNYTLSVLFVFAGAKKAVNGKQIEFFIRFAVIGVIGLLLTEALIFCGAEILKINYLIVKVFAAAVVLFWNYGARKYLIVKRAG